MSGRPDVSILIDRPVASLCADRIADRNVHRERKRKNVLCSKFQNLGGSTRKWRSKKSTWLFGTHGVPKSFWNALEFLEPKAFQKGNINYMQLLITFRGTGDVGTSGRTYLNWQTVTGSNCSQPCFGSRGLAESFMRFWEVFCNGKEISPPNTGISK